MLSVDRPSTECRPITDRYIGQVSTNYRPTIGEVSVNEKLYRPRHIWNDYRPCLDRVSTHYRPTIDRYIDRVSTDYRPSVDRLSTECRPTIDRVSTAISTAISTDISVDITHSKQDPKFLHQTPQNHSFVSREETTPRSLGGQIKVSFITLGNCISQRKITVFIRL